SRATRIKPQPPAARIRIALTPRGFVLLSALHISVLYGQVSSRTVNIAVGDQSRARPPPVRRSQVWPRNGRLRDTIRTPSAGLTCCVPYPAAPAPSPPFDRVACLPLEGCPHAWSSPLCHRSQRGSRQGAAARSASS